MKIKYILASALCAAMAVSAHAKGDISVEFPKTPVAPGETVDIIVNLTQEGEEVRNVECEFKLPKGLKVVGVPTCNTDRLDGFTPTFNINDGGKDSKVTFMSLSGDYITEESGELFRFTVKADEAVEVDFDIASEISTDDPKPTKDEDKVQFSVKVPELNYTVSPVSQAIGLDGEAVVGISLENEAAAGGFTLDITLPEGMTIEKNDKGKVVWQFSSRVGSSRSVSEKWYDDSHVRLNVIDPMSSEEGLIAAGNGEIVSFKVLGSLDLALDSKIVINNISISDLTGEHQYNQNGDVEIDVHNVALENEKARVAANQAAYTADIENLKKLQEVDLGALSTADYYDFIDQVAAQALGDKLVALFEQVNTAYESVEKEGVYESLVDYDALKAEVDALAENAQKAKAAEEARVAANQAAYTADIENLKKLQEVDLGALSTADYYDFIDQVAAQALDDKLIALFEQVNTAYESVENEGVYESLVDYDALKAEVDALADNAQKAKDAAEAEAARVAANNAAAEADMLLIETLQEEYTAVIKTYADEDLSDEMRAIAGKLVALNSAVEAALAAVETEGEYQSPVDAEAIRAEIATAKKAMDDAIEQARVAANDAAYNEDLDALKKLNRQYDDVIIILQDDYTEYIDKTANNQVKYALEDAKDAVEKAYKAVANAGNYESPINAEELEAAVNKLLTDAQDKKFANDEAARTAANQAAAEADMAKLAALQAELTEVIKGNEEFISEADNDAIEKFLGEEYEMAIQAALDAVAETGLYASPINEEELRAFINNVKANIEAAKKAAEEAAAEANAKAWDAIQSQVANVQDAINNFNAVVATMKYASQYEGEDITGPVDAASEWVKTTTETYQAKYEAGELTAEDRVKGEMMEQTQAVNEALNAAAMYDAGRYTMASSNAWYGNEDDEIKGAKEDVMALYADLAADVQASLDAQIAELETAISEMQDALSAYSYYTETTHASFIAQYEEIIAQITVVKEAAQAAWNDTQVKPGDINLDGKVSMVDLTTLVNIVLEKIEKPEAGSDRFVAADANKDGIIDVVDYTAILNIILGKASSPAKVPAMQVSDDVIDFAVSGNELHISLDNFNAYTAMQFDIALPANVSVVSAENTLRTQDMSVAFNKLANGLTRVVIFSESMEAISGIGGDIAVLNLSTETANAAICNVIAADANANGHAIDGVGNATAISNIKYNINSDETVYDLNGRVSNKVNSGVNIIRGKNGSKKIVVR